MNVLSIPAPKYDLPTMTPATRNEIENALWAHAAAPAYSDIIFTGKEVVIIFDGIAILTFRTVADVVAAHRTIDAAIWATLAAGWGEDETAGRDEDEDAGWGEDAAEA